MEGLGWAINIESCIKLCYNLLIPIAVERHNWGKIHSSTSFFNLSHHGHINLQKIIPVDWFHFGGAMWVAKNHWIIPINMKIHPKTDIPLVLFGIPRGIIIPQSIMIMLALCVICWTNPIVLHTNLPNRCLHPNDDSLKIL
jgi:hypothetical protein